MARSPKSGEGFPLSVVRRENEVSENIQDKAIAAAESVEDAASRTMQDIAEQLRALKEQVQALQAATGEVASQAGKVVANSARVAGDRVAEGARAAGDKVAEGARIAGDRAVSGARFAGGKVASAVETYPISTVLIASAAAFLLGRFTASAQIQPSYAESTLDQLKHRLHDLSGRLPPHLKSALRSSLR
jgi:seryl-tRNA synthetase